MTTPSIISVVNHKGGCLKTTLTTNLGAALARLGKRVLLIDLDAQQNLTQSLIGRVECGEGQETLYDALVEESGFDHLICKTGVAGMDIIPCAEDSAGADLSLVPVVGREHVLRSCLHETSELSRYDVVLLDNPPAISLVVVNSLAASDFFLVPCSAEYLPMVGLTLLGNSIGRLEKVAPDLQLLGIVITHYARNERICRQIESMLRKQAGDKLFDTVIRVNTKAKSAPSVRKTIFEYEADPKGRGTEDFTRLAREFMEKLLSAKASALAGRVSNG